MGGQSLRGPLSQAQPRRGPVSQGPLSPDLSVSCPGDVHYAELLGPRAASDALGDAGLVEVSRPL